MTDTLYPTPTRLADLAAASRHQVFRLPNGETRLYYDDGTYRTVNARIGELLTAGWVRVGGAFYSAPNPAQRRWRYVELTGAGRAVLAEHQAAKADTKEEAHG